MTKTDGYDTEPITDLVFTEAQIDMMFFTCLQQIGHPQAEGYQMTDEGFDDLLSALKKIQDYFGEKMTDGEPGVVTAL